MKTASMLSLGMLVSSTLSKTFQPSEYLKQIAHCRTVKRAPVKETVTLNLTYIDINRKAVQAVVLVHGWPSLWSTWSQQILGLQDDYQLIVPDLRGFGESSHPGDVKSSGTLGDIVSDLVCILDHSGVSTATCMGHDWGASVCYEAARSYPHIFTSVVAAVVPYIPADTSFKTTKELANLYPTLNYQSFFDSQTETAYRELDRDIRRTVRATLRTVRSPPPSNFLKDEQSFLSAWDGIEIPPVPFFSDEEEDYFVRQYEINGFKNTLQFYTNENRFLGWKNAHGQGNHTIFQPVLAIYPLQDPVADWSSVARLLGSHHYLPNLTLKLLPGAHWVHLEYPDLFNTVVRDWLASLPPVATHQPIQRTKGSRVEL